MDLTASMWIRLDRVTFELESTFEASSSRRYFLDSAYHIALTLQRNQDVSHESQWQRELRAIIVSSSHFHQPHITYRAAVYLEDDYARLSSRLQHIRQSPAATVDTCHQPAASS